MIKNPYEILGLREGAGMDEIKRAYRKKAKEFHPDLHPDDPMANEKMQQINEAYDMLCNPEKYQPKQNPYGSYQQQGYDSQRREWRGYNPNQNGQYRRYTYYYTTGADRDDWNNVWHSEPQRQTTSIVNPFRGIFRFIGGILLFRFFMTLLRFGLFGFFF